MTPVHRAGRALRKLRGRSGDELRVRGGQALATLLERAHLRDSGEPSDVAFRRRLAPSAAASETDRHADFRDRSAPLITAAFDDLPATLRALHSLDEHAGRATVKRADAVLAGRFDLLGHRGLQFGTPIDWHLDPVARVRAPRVHWSRIAYLDPAVAGDHKLVWELNRHQFLVTLGQAYQCTGDERYANRVVELLGQWMDANPPKTGINWASSLEVSFRAISWLWALQLVRRSPALEPALLARAHKFLDLHARHLERYLSTYFSPNTHLTGEALGLFYLGLFLPELARAPQWRTLGWEILVEQLPRHARPDGVYFEQATYYHRYTVDFYLHVLVLGERHGYPARERIAPQLTLLLDHLMHLTRPDGTIPLTGDEDGGRLLFLDRRAPGDARSALATGAVLLGRADWAFVAGRPSEELVWMLGPEAPEALAALGTREPDDSSRGFPDGGVYVMRDGWGRESSHLAIDCGPHGTMNCGHAHADALAFELCARGRTLLVDPGTFTYTTSKQWRDHFRATASHNTVSIDGRSSSVMDGPFSWRRIARCSTERWHPLDAIDYFEGSHDGYTGLASPATHRRSVLFIRDSALWIIRDVIESDGAHDVSLTFQCAPDVVAHRADDEAVDLVGVDGQTRLHLVTFAERGRFEVDDAWVSPQYGARERASRCRFIAHTGGRATFITVLLAASAGERLVRRVTCERGEAVEISHDDVADLVLFDGARCDALGLATDAHAAWLRRRARRELAAFGIIAGRSIEAGAARIEADALSTACGVRTSTGWRFVGDRVRVSGPEGRNEIEGAPVGASSDGRGER